MPEKKPWYQTGFDADYPLMQTYEESITELQTFSVELLLNLGPNTRILDLCCGYGRHSQIWRENGFDPVGFDLSADLLGIARRNQPGGKWIRGDVRHLPFPSESFDAATFMFISFGYFDTTGEDLNTLREARRVLTPEGRLYLDIKHPANLRANRVPDASFQLGDSAVTEMTRIVQTPEGERYEIRRTLQHPGKPVQRYFYSVRLYEPEEIRGLMEKAGFRGVQVYGGYDARILTPEEPRIIVTGKKGDAPGQPPLYR